MLKITNLQCYYGDLQAVRDANMVVKTGEIVALLGANAAGKSTIVKSISGILDRVEGEIFFHDQLLNNISPHQRVEKGIVQVPEGRQLFPFLTVKENLEMGAYTKRARSHLKENIERVFDLFPRLKEREHQLASTMSGGEQQMCAIGRGLMAMPEIIILDEPTLGLAPLLIKKIFEIVEELRNLGITVLIIEQNVRQTLKIADRAYMLSNGRIVAEGRAEELMESETIRESYLGI
ncbi:ABC transporter ATP-binding protein [Bacillus sp. EB106-08-02-XG196]|nr:ABC transporter ATP-binding protein [Bacillus sp. EB106-08-02-XG196]NWQ43416.1 ABC transporter ATP-binding protein [Bacillus sp. EB106-08-02-XG196]